MSKISHVIAAALKSVDPAVKAGKAFIGDIKSDMELIERERQKKREAQPEYTPSEMERALELIRAERRGSK